MSEGRIEEESRRKVVGRGVVVALGVVCVVLAIGLAGAVANYISTINMLNAIIASKNERIEQLQSAYDILEADYSELQNEYKFLQSEYRSLLTDYNMLSASHDNLVKNYERWRAYVGTYIYLTESFKRTLSDSEILGLVSFVRSLVSDPSDWWRSVKQLYDYVAYNIKYVFDEPFPKPPTVYELESGNYANITGKNSYMSPTETLELGQGDCDDQAVLLYALIKAYNKHIYGKDYELWIMDVSFRNEEAHLAVAFPVKGGKLTIIDPAGQYYTRWLLSLSSNDPHEELESYSNHWGECGGITYITLYRVYEGEAYEVTSGSIQEVADFIEENF